MDETRLALRAELVRNRQDARATIHRGVTLIGLVPVVLVGAVVAALGLGAFGAFASLLIAAAYTLVGGIAGLASIAGGIADYRRSGRDLEALDATHQLPAARLLKR